MSDGQFWAWTIVVCLLVWCAVAIAIAAVWAVFAHRRDPWDDLVERMRVAGELPPGVGGGRGE